MVAHEEGRARREVLGALEGNRVVAPQHRHARAHGVGDPRVVIEGGPGRGDRQRAHGDVARSNERAARPPCAARKGRRAGRRTHLWHDATSAAGSLGDRPRRHHSTTPADLRGGAGAAPGASLAAPDLRGGRAPLLVGGGGAGAGLAQVPRWDRRAGRAVKPDGGPLALHEQPFQPAGRAPRSLHEQGLHARGRRRRRPADRFAPRAAGAGGRGVRKVSIARAGGYEALASSRRRRRRSAMARCASTWPSRASTTPTA